MWILLDESVTRKLRQHLRPRNHVILTTSNVGWNGVRNGRLLALAKDKFDVLITSDQKIPFQQRITNSDVAVVILVAKTNDIKDYLPLVPKVLETLDIIRRGQVVRIHAEQE